jgi:hypothetical protein
MLSVLQKYEEIENFTMRIEFSASFSEEVLGEII